MQLVGISPMRPIGRIGPMRYIQSRVRDVCRTPEERIPTEFRRN
jgi:hypothetical protein